MSDSELRTDDIKVESKTDQPNVVLDEDVELSDPPYDIIDLRGDGVDAIDRGDGEIEIVVAGAPPSGGLKGGINWPITKTGTRYLSQQNQGSFQIFTLLQNQVNYVPFGVNEDISVNQISGRAQPGGSFPFGAGQRLNLGIYNTVGGVPGNKLVDTGYFNVTARNILRTITATPLPRGVYWMASVVTANFDIMGMDPLQFGGLGIRDTHIFNGNGNGLTDVATRYLEMLVTAFDPLPAVAGSVAALTFDAAGLPMLGLRRV